MMWNLIATTEVKHFISWLGSKALDSGDGHDCDDERRAEWLTGFGGRNIGQRKAGTDVLCVSLSYPLNDYWDHLLSEYRRPPKQYVESDSSAYLCVFSSLLRGCAQCSKIPILRVRFESLSEGVALD